MKSKPKLHKCKAKDCKRMIEKLYIYCSYECAAYDGKFNVNTGWKLKQAKLK